MFMIILDRLKHFGCAGKRQALSQLVHIDFEDLVSCHSGGHLVLEFIGLSLRDCHRVAILTLCV